MKIVIIGIGKVGYAIAAQLTREGHDITVVDDDPRVVQHTSDSLDVMAICGNGASLEVMREAGTAKSDLLIACSPLDEVNLLCCIFAKKLGCENTIARVRTPEYAEQSFFLKDELGLSMTINPEQIAAREMFRLLEIPGVLKRDTFAGGRVEIVEVIPRPGDILDGMQLFDLRKKVKCSALVGAVQRGKETFIPDGSFTLQAGDKVYVCAPANEIVAFLRSIGEYKSKAKNVMLIGGGRVSNYLTYMLLKAGSKVKVLEIDPDKAVAFAERFPEAAVVCADGSSERVLQSEHAGKMDAVATLTNLDEENLILCMYLTHIGVPQVLTKVDHTEFGNLISDKGVKRIISPKKLCADAIIRYVRAMQNTTGSSVQTLHHLVDGHMDALEFNVTASTRCLGRTLKDITLKPNILVSSINRKGKIIIPGGNDEIREGDTVVVVADSRRVILDINDIFADEG